VWEILFLKEEDIELCFMELRELFGKGKMDVNDGRSKLSREVSA